ncbi:MAG: alpha/beta fold hydrolase, partial [Candidatus Competibacteraceae bacterium]|nr:alpha/beta fold hydrolase [Candidatus Competibacteraceae bacterium]
MPKQRSGDIELYYEITGQGHPLLFIHGLGSCTEDWEQQVAFFAQRFLVITFDVRGHGRSDKPPDPYSIPLFARDTVGLLDVLGIASAHVVGLSLGGMIAFQLAVDVPRRVDSLVIVNSGPAVPA